MAEHLGHQLWASASLQGERREGVPRVVPAQDGPERGIPPGTRCVRLRLRRSDRVEGGVVAHLAAHLAEGPTLELRDHEGRVRSWRTVVEAEFVGSSEPEARVVVGVPLHEHDVLTALAADLESGAGQRLADAGPLLGGPDGERGQGDGRRPALAHAHASEQNVPDHAPIDLGYERDEGLGGTAESIDELGFGGPGKGLGIHLEDGIPVVGAFGTDPEVKSQRRSRVIEGRPRSRMIFESPSRAQVGRVATSTDTHSGNGRPSSDPGPGSLLARAIDHQRHSHLGREEDPAPNRPQRPFQNKSQIDTRNQPAENTFWTAAWLMERPAERCGNRLVARDQQRRQLVSDRLVSEQRAVRGSRLHPLC